MNKAYKIRLYPNNKQKELIDKTIGCARFIYNQMLSERISVYQELKNDKEKLYAYKYKTEKELKFEFEFLKEVSSYALQQSRIDLDTAYKNFFRRVKQGSKQKGFPKFKSKKKSKNSYREINGNYHQKEPLILIKDNKIKFPKLGYVKFKGLSKNFQGIIKSVTIIKNKNNTYEASILVEQNKITKIRKSNNVIGIDLGLKEFAVCSDGTSINGIKNKFYEIENKIKKQQKHLNRKYNVNKENINSKNYNKAKIKLNNFWQYRQNFLNHFQWHLANKLCSENQIISLESLNVSGMRKNRKLSHAIQNINWSSFVAKLEQKAIEYETIVIKIDRWFPSSKLCSMCGQIKKDLILGDRTYICDCGLIIDRDLNAAINILKVGLKTLSVEYTDYKCGEIIRPIEYNSNGSFYEAFTKNNKI
jgi:putative transposase